MAELQKARMTEIQKTVQRTVATFAVAEGKMEPEGITENSNFGDFKTTFVNSPGISGEFLTDGKFLQYSTMTGVKVMTTEQCLATQLFQAAHLVIELKETIKDLKDRLVIVAVAEREIDKHRAEAARTSKRPGPAGGARACEAGRHAPAVRVPAGPPAGQRVGYVRHR